MMAPPIGRNCKCRRWVPGFALACSGCGRPTPFARVYQTPIARPRKTPEQRAVDIAEGQIIFERMLDFFTHHHQGGDIDKTIARTTSERNKRRARKRITVNEKGNAHDE